jgi:hypothetical protein
MQTIRRGIFGVPFILLGLVAPFTTDCALIKGVSDAAKLTKCPDMTRIESIDSFDFAGDFGLPPPVAAKLKTGVEASVAMKSLADKIDAELLDACGGITKDLGDPTVYTDGHAACGGAAKAIADTKAKMGAKAAIALDLDEPRCLVDVNAYSDCAAHCDPTVKPGSVDVQCDGQIQGTCSGQCKGDCQLSAAAACSGECTGTCDAKVAGSCDGTCTGTCDGKKTPDAAGATCSGSCEGTCSGHMKGTCGGQCGGSCRVSDGASCAGSCTGDCSVKMDSPKCTGAVKPPQMDANCKAKCDAQVQANASCTPPRLAVRITGTADEQAASALRATIEKNLPRIVEIGKGMAKNVGQIAGNVVAIVQGGQGVIQTAMADKIKGAALLACVGVPFKDALTSAASVGANVKVSVDVQASVSASGTSG